MQSKFPAWLCKHLRADDDQRIADAIAQAEQKTTGEVVVMLVRQSMRFGHVYPILALLLFAFAMVAHYLWWLSFAWNSEMPRLWSIEAVLILLVFSQILAWFLSRSIKVRRWLSNAADQNFYAEARATSEFYQAGLYKTDERTGILIFLSFTEHRVVVLADEGIAKKLPPETWNYLVQGLLNSIKQSRLGDGLTEAVRQCGEILANHFPPKKINNNELPNHFIVKD